jgi:hypothetical protein
MECLQDTLKTRIVFLVNEEWVPERHTRESALYGLISLVCLLIYTCRSVKLNHRLILLSAFCRLAVTVTQNCRHCRSSHSRWGTRFEPDFFLLVNRMQTNIPHQPWLDLNRLGKSVRQDGDESTRIGGITRVTWKHCPYTHLPE